MAMPLFDVRGFRLSDLYRATSSEDDAIKWCQERDLLWEYPQCQQCGHLMTYDHTNQRFRCCRKDCIRPPFQYLRKGTFFEGSHLSIAQILQFVYHWSMDRFHQTDYMHQLEIGSEHTVVDWRNFCRDVCGQYLIDNPMRIGGPDKVVEIDECMLVRRKYNRGRVVKEQWVFGGVEVGSNKCFLVKVAQRNTATLLPLIHKYILPGSTIISDEWAAYNAITRMPPNCPQIYAQHLTVTHAYNFVDPITGACTNHVETMWQKAKQKHKARYGTHRALLDTYLAEFMWRKLFRQDTFHHFLSQVRMMYPCY